MERQWFQEQVEKIIDSACIPNIYLISSHGTIGLASMYVCSTFAQMVRSPVLKEYFLLQPCCPNLLLPRTIEWNQQREKRHALKSSFFVQFSMRSWEKLAHPLVIFDLISLGASFATFTDPCIKLSGMFLKLATGGGSADIKHLKSGWAFSWTTSSNLSKVGTHDCIKWQFCNITHPPFLAKLCTTASAGFSCPWPIDMFLKLPFSNVTPFSFPRFSTQGVGSTCLIEVYRDFLKLLIMSRRLNIDFNSYSCRRDGDMNIPEDQY